MNTHEINEQAINEYERWRKATRDDFDFAMELDKLSNEKEELIDAFYCDLHFGTSGLRGIIGPGTNRMNDYVIRRTTMGLSNYLNTEYENPKVVIAYDSRKNSRRFAKETGRILSGKGIQVFLFPEIAPVSLLSYAIKRFGCTMGIMITASHNPKIFNGYKVYNQHGYQIVGSETELISAEIDKHDYFENVTGNETIIYKVDREIINGFIDDIIAMSPEKAEDKFKNLSIVYTPLNGTGNLFVRKVLCEVGFTNVTVVPSQELPDENFTTCVVPNPEKVTVYNEAFKVLDQIHGDLIIATDPDCDRVGVAVYHQGTKILLTGNQLGILLLDYLCAVKKPKPGQIIIKSIVSSPLADKIAEKNGLKVINTLTGFKYIGEVITALDKEGRLDDYYFGFEESNGYLFNGFIRDKDGVSTAMITAEMAAYYKDNGTDPVSRLHEIGKELGLCIDKTSNFYFEGHLGRQIMKNIMAHFRNNVKTFIGKKQIVKKIDYLEQTILPKEDALEYRLGDGSVFLIRPSGTEAKIKVYLFEADPSSQLESDIKSIIDKFKESNR